MKLLIDNLDGSGPRDYTVFIDASTTFSVVRKLNAASTLRVSLFLSATSVAVPVCGARITLGRSDGSYLFAGYLSTAPSREYLGWGERGSQYRCMLVALSDVMVLDRKAAPLNPSFVARTAGDAIRQLTQDALPGWFDLSVESGDTIPYFGIDPSKPWTSTASEIALAARGCFRDDNGKLIFGPLALNTYTLAEGDPAFSPAGLRLESTNRLINDLTVLGRAEPAAHVKDYFVGDGYTTTFYLSQVPFTRSGQTKIVSRTILDEEYIELDPAHWSAVDPQQAISVSNGQLQVAGGTGIDGQTCVNFIEKIELGGATVLQHGDIVFNGPSDGVIGGLYGGTISAAGCVAGFRIAPSGANSNIQALVGGVLTGTALTTQPGHHYLFTTQLYPGEIYRMQQVFHSSLHPSGNSRGGDAVACDVRVVLEVHDIDPANPETQVASATVLYDGVVSDAPGFCTYGLIDAARMECSVAFTEIFLGIDAVVRSTVPQQNSRTRRTGSLRDGAECHVSTSTLQFYPEYIPAANETIQVTYRSSRQAVARVKNSAGIAVLRSGADDGVRGSIRQVAAPVPRTSADCETAALALLDDAGAGWTGEYQVGSQFLPGAASDIFPGDGLAINVPSRAASFVAIVRDVEAAVIDLNGETLHYILRFVDAGDPSLDCSFTTAQAKIGQTLTPIDLTQVGNVYLPDLINAEVTNVTSTTVTIDAGLAIPAGGGVEVRYSDAGWGNSNNRNLLGRFTSSIFTLPRYARAQDYFLRSYDSSSPAKYSRYSAALHVDYPLDYET